MCKVKFVKVQQIFDIESGVAVGMEYRDSWMVLENFKSVEDAFERFKIVVDCEITKKQSIILCRDDVKRFAKAIAAEVLENSSKADSKSIFRYFKEFLYDNYEVKRIILNPRTLEYYPMNKAFIINKL